MKALVLLLVASVAHAAPRGAKAVRLDYTWESASHDEFHATIAVDRIPAKLIEALYASLTNLMPADEPQHCLSHTDNYPQLKISIIGDEPIELATTSNCHAYMPWNVTIGDKLYVQYSGAVFPAVRKLFEAAGQKLADEPTEKYEAIELGRYDARDTPKGVVGACVTSLERNPQVKLMLGAFKVDDLRLTCELAHSPNCSAGNAETVLDSAGVLTLVELPCTAGTIAISPHMATALGELRRFLASKPVRAIVKLSARPPRASGVEWYVDADGAPMLLWNSKTHRIKARVSGETAYWNELGVDVTNRTEVELDVDGHIL